MDINNADNIVRLSEELSPQGLFISANLDTKEEALELMKKMKICVK
ncbi:MAG: hypothetical protein LBD23_01630 [Oscillospiraceae bacterium]|nr:hypothetical protein [Oscillospiraceae bacterium]